MTKEAATLYTQGENKNSNDGSNSSVSDFAVGEDGSVYLMLYNSVVDASSLGDKYDNATLEDVRNFYRMTGDTARRMRRAPGMMLTQAPIPMRMAMLITVGSWSA